MDSSISFPLSESIGVCGGLREKNALRKVVRKIELAPETLSVTAFYGIPGQLMNTTIAGAVYRTIHDEFKSLFHELRALPRMGRRPVLRII